MNRKQFKVLLSFWFLFALAILLLNDFLLKPYFGNWFTGKLSDFSGLFVFSVFWIAIFPKHKVKIFLLTGFLFLLWKSPFSQPIINLWNSMGAFHINRVVDYSDLVALIVLPIAYHIYRKETHLFSLKISPAIPLVMSVFAFCATSYQRDFDYGKTYNFPFSKTELITRINDINDDGSNNLPLSLNIENANNHIFQDSDTLWYFVSGYNTIADTVWVKTDEIDTVYHHVIPIKDTVYVNQSGIFHYSIPVKNYMAGSKTDYCRQVPAKIKIGGNENSSSLTLVKIFTQNCMGMFEKEAKNHEKENLLKAFETELIKKIKTAQPIEKRLK